jgi:hypothetical protein
VKFLVYEIFSCAAKLVWHFYYFSMILVNFAISLFYRKEKKKEKGLHGLGLAHSEAGLAARI